MEPKKTKDLKEAFLRSRTIDAELNEERKKKQREVQLLTLGSAGSGKSTFSKQLRVLYGDGFPEAERVKLRPNVYSNVRVAIKRLVRAMEKLGIQFEKEESKDLSENLVSVENGQHCYELCADDKLSSEETVAIRALWQDKGVQDAWEQRHLYHLAESAKYFLDNIDQISTETYIPSVQDILYIRLPTTAIEEHEFSVNGLTYRVIDVAGQKSQRKKWIHFFEGVTAVLFFTALSGFNELMDDDDKVNCLHDSLDLFRDLAYNKWLEQTDFILFLNKHDLFVEKLKTTSIKSCFPHYDGPNTPEDCTDFIQGEFLKRKPVKKTVYPHITCATDTNLMKTIISDVHNIIVDINLRRVALL
ncbi:guanine nucleotide-binding protein subunit alpha-11-like isoform X3 [Branchiostoma floridae]|uniref:Guanine nucleotide-binding protein subunit alpha-11-like isoform X3 n=1 Tax=Branchiostoma floridae TaxID=7739 RepID=A0A9J7MPG1_BRAFL|nr:guanine nucleotide-binding protein subunit alpha-11-like isoform X3 [Branchiostoma floridae]